MSKTPRQLALAVLERTRRDKAFSDSALSAALSESALDAKDRALVSRLVSGVVQNTILLDFYIDHFSGGKKLEPTIRDILRLSLYQILFLDKIPNHAAVSEGVQLCKQSGRTRAAGFVNAILRRATGKNLPEIPNENTTQYLSIKHSTPIDLVALFINEFGADFTEKLLEANNTEPPLTIQTNTLKTTAAELTQTLESEGVTATPHPWLGNALNISASGGIANLKSFKNGLFYVQDAAAALSILAASPQSGQAVLDLCAAPGGKSFAAAILMQNHGTITACDIHENKLNRATTSAKSLGIEIITTQLQDATAPHSAFNDNFDLVIADAPCSGLGVIRKKPDIRNKNLTEIAELPKLQQQILNTAAQYVKSGGTLLYSTCTILKCENEDVISAFLKNHPEFTPEAFTLPAPIGFIPAGQITLYPHTHETDGFFICKLRKNEK